MHWLTEITKAQLSQAKTFFITSFYKKNEKRGGKDKFGQVRTRQQIRIMEKKGTQILVVSEENLSVSEEEKVRSKDNWAKLGRAGPSWAELGRAGPSWAELGRAGPGWANNHKLSGE